MPKRKPTVKAVPRHIHRKERSFQRVIDGLQEMHDRGELTGVAVVAVRIPKGEIQQVYYSYSVADHCNTAVFLAGVDLLHRDIGLDFFPVED